jgi:outer membrane protein TolC
MVNVATQEDILSVRQDLANAKQDLANAKQELQTAIDSLALRLTVRLGIMLAAGIAALGAIVKLSP